MKIQFFPYDYSKISKCRTYLMGIGIIGVMLAHYSAWANIQGTPSYFCKPFIGLVFTEGFLFLSGFGLFYSFSKNTNKKFFWIKRVNRLWIPFVIMYIPYAIYSICRGEIWVNEILELLTLRFWILGNAGLWYISVTVFLYFLFPFIYRFVISGETVIRILFLVGLFYLLAHYCPVKVD